MVLVSSGASLVSLGKGWSHPQSKQLAVGPGGRRYRLWRQLLCHCLWGGGLLVFCLLQSMLLGDAGGGVCVWPSP